MAISQSENMPKVKKNGWRDGIAAHQYQVSSENLLSETS